MKIPDLISTIKAYRTWAWDAEGIASLNCERWIPGEAMAANCLSHFSAPYWSQVHSGQLIPNEDGSLPPTSHVAPAEACTCGIYAAKDFSHLVNIGYADHGIHGEVELWGTVMEHRLGYRAQFAYPKNFTVPEDMLPYQMPDLENRLGILSLYGVPIYFSLWRSPEAIAVKTYESTRMLLWDKENGFSEEGVEALAARARKWYEYKIEQATLNVGDRVFIKDKGIAIVYEEIGDKQLRLQLFNRMLVLADRADIKWSTRNHRWETKQMGFTIACTKHGMITTAKLL